jgi:hypothetical protein
MNTKRELELRERDKSPARRAITAVFIVLFVVICYLLARSMVSHNFSGGGRNNIQSHQH